MAMPMDLAGDVCSITASIGVTEVKPDDGRDASQILRDPDAAMYKGKVYRAATHFAEPAQ